MGVTEERTENPLHAWRSPEDRPPLQSARRRQRLEQSRGECVWATPPQRLLWLHRKAQCGAGREPLASCLGFKDAGVQTFTANGAVCCLLAGGGTASGLERPPNSFVHEAEKPWNGDGEHFERRFCTAQLYRRRSRKQHVLSSSLKAAEFIQHRQAAPRATPVNRS